MKPTTPVEAILQFKVGEKSSENAYQFLLLETKKLSSQTGEAFQNFLTPYEKAYMDEYLPTAVKWRGNTYDTYADAQQAGAPTSEIMLNRKKNGDYKYRTFLPNAYSSAKSVISNALDAGVALFDSSDNPIGKSALSSAIKEVSSEKLHNPMAACLQAIRRIRKQVDALSSEELDTVRRKLAEI